MVARSKRSGSVRSWRGGIAGPLIVASAIIFAALRLIPGERRRPAETSTGPIVAAFDAVDVPVPVDAVPAGTRVRDIRFRTVTFPAHQVPDGALRSLQSVLDATTVAALPANLPLFEKNFQSGGRFANPVTDNIPSGMRAMTVKVDATTAVEGWAGSGSIVDVLLIGKDRTAVIAEKVRILSAERIVAPIEGSAAPNVPSTVTLLVTQEQCLAINTAIPLGKMAFALRSPKDDESWISTDYTAEQLKSGAAAPEGERSTVNGYISFSQGSGGRSFVLSDGRWMETTVVPEGFRFMQPSAAKPSQRLPG